MIKRIEARAWILVLLIAALTRWYALDATPPGVKYDTASSAVYALNVVYNDARPFYIIPSGAPEPLMVYLQALAILFGGPTIFTLRFLSAAIGVAVVALLYALARETTRDERAALVAAFALAVAITPINVARTGLRANLTPLFEAAWLVWFWRGWRGGQGHDFVIAGAMLGLGVYTYIATLAVWLIAAALWAHQFFFARPRWRARLGQIAAMILVALILAAPRVAFQVAFPTAAIDRASEVNILHNPAIRTLGLAGVVGERVLDYVRMFGVAWQGELYNVLHRPLLDPFLFACFLVGVAVCLTRWRRVEWVWAPLTLAVMLLPDLLGANEPSPNELRTIGVLPPAFFLVGVGAAFWLAWLSQRAWLRAAGIFVTALALTTGAAIGVQAYLGDFAAAAQTGPDMDYNRTEIAEAQWITQQREPVFLPLNEYARSPVHFLVAQRAARVQAALTVEGALDSRAAPARAWVLYPLDHKRPRTEGRAYVHDPAAFVLVNDDAVLILPPARNDVETLLQARAPDATVRDSLGKVAATAFLISQPADWFGFAPAPAQAPRARFDHGLTLVAGSLDNSRVAPGASVGATLFWQARAALTVDAVLFAHVLDLQGRLVVGADVAPALGAYPTYLWKPGEIVATHHALKVPAHTAPGKYVVEIGVYDALTQNRFEVLDADDAPLDSRVIVGTFKVASPVAAYQPSQRQRAEFARVIALTGFDLPTPVAPGDNAPIALYWQALAAMSADYTVFVHLLDADGKIVAQVDAQPQAGQYPTSIWEPGEQVRDTLSLKIPANLPSGRYRLEVGWYDWQTAGRLLLSDGGDHIVLDRALEVEP